VSKPAKSAQGDRQVAPGGFSWWPYAVVGALLVAIVAFVVVTRGGAPSGIATPSGPSGERGLRVGATVPAVPLNSSDGTSISLDQLSGSKVVLYFYEGGG